VSRGATLALLTLLPASLAAQQPSTYSLTGSAAAVYNLVGEATIQGGTGSSVSVQVTPVGSDAGQLKIQNDEIRGRQTLRVVYPEDRIVYRALGRGSNSRFSIREDGTWGGDWNGERDWHSGRGRQITVRGDGDGLEAAANLRITIPAGKRVAVYVGVGRVEVSNVDGDLRVDAASADITARETRGTLHLDTGSGNLRLERAEGSTGLDTGSGDVVVTGYQNGTLNIDSGSGSINASDLDVQDLQIDTGSGDIELEGVTTLRLSLESGSGSIRATLRNSPGVAEVETGSGDVTLRLPDPADATVDLETGSGDFTIDFPLQLIKKSEGTIRGRIGAGNGRISIETGSGDITLTK
jgi:lia operon protein LiaG